MVQREGEFTVDNVKSVLADFFNVEKPAVCDVEMPPLPERAPTLCAGCPHRASFYAFKEAARKHDAIFTGDIGCYTLGVMPPLAAVDTCLCMGASVTIASGLSAVEKDRKHIAFLGDSTFFHTGLSGLINAVYNNSDIVLVVLDNRTTAMTGHQPHPGLEKTATGLNEKYIDIAGVARAIGVGYVREVDPYDLEAARQIAAEVVDCRGPAVVVMKRECIAIVKSTKKCEVEADKCIGCSRCVKNLGCPALTPVEDKVEIGSSCVGCTVCAQICPVDAIREVETCG
ncbi:MAG TPA: thiamine pyrophosphate-dependent enzyme, partial [Desulfobacteria bacterium]|nr:thiamine pyrophosphate-dependent enzyme [Desulfobacteria bacterium]